MKKMLPWFIIAFLLGLIFSLLKNRDESPKVYIHTDTVTVMKYLTDTLYKEIKTNVPYLVKQTDTVVLQPDTAAILALYNKTCHYSDTLSDSCIIAVIDDQVFENRIVDRKFRYSLQCQKEIHSTSLYYRNGFYAGPLVGGSAGSFKVGAQGMYQWGNKAVSLGVDALDRQVSVAYMWRLGR